MTRRTIDARVRKQVGAEGRAPLPSYAWPGGYPIYYLDHDDAVICPKCARSKWWSGKYIIDSDVNWEDAALYCENCNERIESAYAEDEHDTK